MIGYTFMILVIQHRGTNDLVVVDSCSGLEGTALTTVGDEEYLILILVRLLSKYRPTAVSPLVLVTIMMTAHW